MQCKEDVLLAIKTKAESIRNLTYTYTYKKLPKQLEDAVSQSHFDANDIIYLVNELIQRRKKK
jgi:hypothetical protein